MADEHDKTIGFGAFGGREEYEANQRRKIVSLLDHFRTQAELENFLFDMEAMRRDWKSITEDVKRMDDAIDDMVEAQERRSWLVASLTAFLKWAAIAGGGLAALRVFWEMFKSSLGDGP